VVKVAASVLQEKMETDQMMEVVAEQERKTEENLNKAIELRDRWRKTVDQAREDAKKIRTEAIHPRNINFDSPADHQPLATPKDNMKMAMELLAKNDEEIDIGHLRTLIARTMKQQSKADTLRRLESNPEACVSTAQKNALRRERHDEQSRIGSMERRRKTREHPNPTPISSDTPRDKNKGKGVMYSGKDKYQNPSPPRNQPAPPPHRR
jgi:hypothetical protein